MRKHKAGKEIFSNAISFLRKTIYKSTSLECNPLEFHRYFGASYCLHLACPLFPNGSFLDPEDGGNIFLRNVVGLTPDYAALHFG
jgi:hypothetical protein